MQLADASVCSTTASQRNKSRMFSGVLPSQFRSHARAGDKFTFTIEEGANGSGNRISVNYDGFIEDVGVGDILLVDGGLQSLVITDKQGKDVHTEVVDGGTMTSRWARHVLLMSWVL